ncbi:hypothetical protein KJI95_04610 [Shewanella sp. JM162201]|uniref:Uncharacterized protein n=1 Tax=Shewanella jiangmenensis TaxID=2837387 RepID=A0ABS5V2C6_9GAMM|nr:hypothetical protein [Shewanella jiangmenensis]MBT1443809.1 hypothetical protein [Shewanella jiangmenensis]
MALDALADVLETAGRLFGRFISEAVIEFMLKGVGYLICRPFKPSVDPDGLRVLLVGLLFWVLLIWFGVELYGFIRVDACLDGGSFDYALGACST